MSNLSIKKSSEEKENSPHVYKLQEKIVDFETAKMACENGFHDATVYYYEDIGILATDLTITNLADGTKWYQSHKYYPAPTQSHLQKWLRENHNLHTSSEPSVFGWTGSVTDCYGVQFYQTVRMGFKVFEDGIEDALKEALKIVKKTKIKP